MRARPGAGSGLVAPCPAATGLSHELSGLAIIAQRDVIKLLRDRPRLAVNLAFPILLIGGLGSILQPAVGRATGLNAVTLAFTGVLAASLFQSAAAGMISIIEDRENDFSRELFVTPVARLTLGPPGPPRRVRGNQVGDHGHHRELPGLAPAGPGRRAAGQRMERHDGRGLMRRHRVDHRAVGQRQQRALQQPHHAPGITAVVDGPPGPRRETGHRPVQAGYPPQQPRGAAPGQRVAQHGIEPGPDTPPRAPR